MLSKYKIYVLGAIVWLKTIIQNVMFTIVKAVCPLAGTDIEVEGHDRSELALPGYQSQLLKDAVLYGKLRMDCNDFLLWKP